ncbi:MAG: cation:proton antiporter [Firmicutes bacterium]|nr:cation:proton antiporter [Bacillota bacterium]
MASILQQTNETTRALMSLSLILFSGFLLTRLTKKASLPNVTGFIIAGILIGPHVLNLIPVDLINNMGFVSDIALAFISFGVGRFFVKESFKATGKSIIVITILESLLAGLLITLSMRYLFKLEWSFSLLLGAIATATTPASTMATIRQYKAKGPFVNTLLQVVALDDAVCLIAFSLALALITGGSGGSLSFLAVATPILLNIAALLLGFLSGLGLHKLMTPDRSQDNRLILTTAILLGLASICAYFDISPLLASMVFGATYINLSRDDSLFKQIDGFIPPFLSIFFVVSGMNLDLTTFAHLGIMGVVYFLIRIVGKYAGAYLGCAITDTAPEIKKYLGLALVPQAGVSIGLAFLGKRVLPPATGNMLLTIILSSSVLYELIGPASAKFALFQSGAIKRKKKEASRPLEYTAPVIVATESTPDSK